MNIGFDAKRLFHNRTGLGNYSRATVHLLAENYPQNEYFLYTPKPATKIDVGYFNEADNIHIRMPGAGSFRPFWRSMRMVNAFKDDKIDLYHGLSYELPIGITATGTAAVVTIHDLIFLRFPQYYKTIDRKIYTWKSRYACKNANRIIAISQKTKADIIDFFGTDESKIDVIYQGCDSDFYTIKSALEKEQIRRKYQLPGEFLLSVGTIEERKNLELLIKAMPLLSVEVKLVVVGKPTSYLQKIKKLIAASNLQNQVIFLHDVVFAELPLLYQMASAFIYPSRYEGFGIPVLEALNSGTPVIAATGSCLEEAGGPHSLYVHPDDEKALAKSIARVLTDENKRTLMIEKGLEYARRFRDKEIAENIMNCYQKTRLK